MAGLATGFYLGTAGRNRYRQMNAKVRGALHSPTVDNAAGKAKAVVDLGVERARDIVGTRLGHDQGIITAARALAPGPSRQHSNGGPVH